MIRQLIYLFRFLCGLVLLLSVTTLAPAAESYYLMDDGSRWRSQDGTLIKGIHKSSLYICKQDGACRDLMAAGREMNAWRQRGTMWYEVNAARQQLEMSESDRVALDADTGRALYNSADRGSRTVAE